MGVDGVTLFEYEFLYKNSNYLMIGYHGMGL